MSKYDDYIVTAHVSPDCSKETLHALAEMMKCLIDQTAQRRRTTREAAAPKQICPMCHGHGVIIIGGHTKTCYRCNGSGQI